MSKTFLQLVQGVARESGTIPSASGNVPTTVASQVGQLANCVVWVNEAYRQIQQLRPNWRFMSAELGSSAVITSGTRRYTAASWNISDFGSWKKNGRVYSLYSSSIGVSDEQRLDFMEWDDYRQTYLRGTQQANKPMFFSVSPADEFCIAQVPDATLTQSPPPYAVNGEYWREAQDLTNNTDVPILPGEFHDIIMWKALLLLDQFDEAPLTTKQDCERKYMQYLNALERRQLPKITINADGPFA